MQGQQPQRQQEQQTPTMRRRRRLIWHRYRDLRLHDNPLYQHNLFCPDDEDTSDEDDTSSPQPQCISVFIFDDDDFMPQPSTTTASISKQIQWSSVLVGPHASRILLQSVEDLRRSLKGNNSNLIIRKGSTVPILLELMRQIQPTEMWWCEEPGVYERRRSEFLRKAIQTEFPTVKNYTTLDCTLYHPDDLPRSAEEWQRCAHPKKQVKKHKKSGKKSESQQVEENSTPTSVTEHLFDISPSRFVGMPNILGDFRRAAREKAGVRPCLATPDLKDTYQIQVDPGELPALEELLQPILSLAADSAPIMGLPISIIHEVCQHSSRLYMETQQVSYLSGGETAGLAHLVDFCQNHAASAQRNLACVDNHQSSRLSHYLSFGSLSPRRIVEEAERQNDLQRQKGTSEDHKGSCDWLISHMTMRDFFLYSCLASDTRFYHADGIPVNKKAAESIQWRSWKDPDVVKYWEQWATGNTGLPLVDAAMREMIQTGYCSNRVRQNAASVLTKDLGIDWRAGAEWFQFLLCDHCVGVNWGNWLYFSGKGSDPKNRHFRTVSQAIKYDEDGVYVKKWLPELTEFISKVENSHPTSIRHEIHLRPWDFDTDSAKWKEPMVSPKTQYTWHDLERLKQHSRMTPASDTDGTTLFRKEDLEQWIPMMKQGTLHKAYRLVNLAALQKLDEVLKSSKIEYWVSGGTLLGALRHHGFIPHDDDIDIECHHSDQERIAAIPADENYLGFEKGGVWKGFPVYKMKFRGDVSIDVFPRKTLLTDEDEDDELEAKCFPTRDEVFPLDAVAFCNIHVSIPRSRDFLLRLYGNDCFENVLVWNHDFNFEHGKGFDQQKVVAPLDNYNALLNECGLEQPMAGKNTEETYQKAFAVLSENEFLKQLKSYKWQRTLRWNRADAEWRFEQEQS